MKESIVLRLNVKQSVSNLQVLLVCQLRENCVKEMSMTQEQNTVLLLEAVP